MNRKEVEEIIKNNPLSPNLSHLDLSFTDLEGIDLKHANLSYTNFNYTNLKHVNLSHSNLCNSDLEFSNLSYADLSYANLEFANLEGIDLKYTILYYANLSYSNLCNSDLKNSPLYYTYLNYANLKNADLRGAIIQETNLKGATFYGTILNLQCPEEGSYIGWKKCKNDVIVKLLIPEDALRSSATTRKCRASKVKVLDVFGADIGISKHNHSTIYKSGNIIEIENFDKNRWHECSTGIHHFITRKEAEEY